MRDQFQRLHPIIQLILLSLLGFGAAFIGLLAALLVFSGSNVGWATLQNLQLIDPSDFQSIFFLKVVQIAQALGLFVVPYALFRWISPNHAWRIGNIREFKLSAAIIMFVSMLAAIPLVNVLAGWNSSLSLPSSFHAFEEWARETEANAEALLGLFLRMDSLGDLVFNVLLSALIPAVAEEMLFRGTMQPLLLQWLKNRHLSVWLCAFLFSFLHLQFLGFVPRFVLGLVLGYSAIWSGHLYLPIIGHFTNNVTAVIVTWFIQRNQIDASYETFGVNPEEWLAVGVGSTLLCLGLFFIQRSFTHTTDVAAAELSNQEQT